MKVFDWRAWPRWARYLSIPVGIVATYLVVGNLFHRVFFPVSKPDPATFPRVGDELVSEVEGVRTKIVDVVDGWIVAETTLAPRAPGPPKHVHETFDETFVVREGTLSLWVDGQVVQLGPGETYRIERGTPHQPFNSTDEPIVIAGDEPAMPLEFAACLVQLYSILDRTDPKQERFAMALQVSVLDSMCDSKLHDVPDLSSGPLNWFLAPLARVLGYSNYYPARSLHPPGSEDLASTTVGASVD